VFVPVGLVRRLIDSGKPLQPEVEQRFMTVLFSDVEGFTTLAEQLAPHELTEQTSRYFENVTGAVAEEQGTIDKFIGDSVMAFWGAPACARRPCLPRLPGGAPRAPPNGAAQRRMGRDRPQTDAGAHRRALRRRRRRQCRLAAAAELHGDGRRVNIASRVEGLNKQFGTTICISDDVRQQVGDRVVSRPIQLLSVRGRTGRFVIHELLGIAGSDDPELAADEGAVRLCQLTAAAWSALAAGAGAEAQRRYEAVLSEFPNDPVARHMSAFAAGRGRPAAGGERQLEKHREPERRRQGAGQVGRRAGRRNVRHGGLQERRGEQMCLIVRLEHHFGPTGEQVRVEA
jgi:adenylate cyclase